jgi:hypothetical protein
VKLKQHLEPLERRFAFSLWVINLPLQTLTAHTGKPTKSRKSAFLYFD